MHGTVFVSWARPGQNLAFTFALRQDLWPHEDASLSFFAANAARRALAGVSGENIFIKWPNDLILHRKKIGGILIEKRKIHGTGYCLIGIGINVNQEDFAEMPWVASLKLLTGKDFAPEKIAEELFHQLLSSPENPETQLAEYNQHLFGRDKVSVFELNRNRQNGIIRSTDAQGWLTVDMENLGRQRFFHKEIKMLY